MKKRLLLAILPVIAIVLEALPFGAVLHFADAENIYRRTFSYFDLTPYGYANFGPLIAASLTCLMLVEVIIYAFTDKVRYVLLGTSLLAVSASLAPVLVSEYSALGAVISAVLILQAVFVGITVFKKTKPE